MQEGSHRHARYARAGEGSPVCGGHSLWQQGSQGLLGRRASDMCMELKACVQRTRGRT